MYVKSMCRWPEFIVWTCHGLGRVGQGEVQGQFLKMKYSWHPKSRNLKKPSFKQMGSSCIKQTVDQCIKDNPVWSFYKTQTCGCSLAETCGVEMWLRLSFPFSHPHSSNYKPGICDSIWLCNVASFYETHYSFHLFIMKHHSIIVERWLP